MSSYIFFRKIANRFLAVSFCVFLLMPFVDNCLKIDKFPALRENRRLAERPQLKLDGKSILSFPVQFDAFFKDHFGFRNSLIWLYNRIHFGWAGYPYNAEVVIGKDNWLYANAGKGLVDEYRGTKMMSQSDLEQWKKVLVERQEWLAKRNIKYVVVFVPDKHGVYPEYLPNTVRQVNGKTRLDQVVEYLRKNTTLTVMDLRETMNGAKSMGRLYHKTDTHWNDLGAYVAYQAIMKTIAGWFPGAKPYSLSDFKIVGKAEKGRDLAQMIAMQNNVHEENITLVPKNPRTACMVSSGLLPSETAKQKLYDYRPFATQKDDPKMPRAVMFCDSFITALFPFLSENFSWIAYYRQDGFDPEVIEKERPDVVIQERCERYAMPFRPVNYPQVAENPQMAGARTK